MATPKKKRIVVRPPRHYKLVAVGIALVATALFCRQYWLARPVVPGCLSLVLPNLTSENLAVSGSNSIQHIERIENLPG